CPEILAADRRAGGLGQVAVFPRWIEGRVHHDPAAADIDDGRRAAQHTDRAGASRFVYLFTHVPPLFNVPKLFVTSVCACPAGYNIAGLRIAVTSTSTRMFGQTRAGITASMNTGSCLITDDRTAA